MSINRQYVAIMLIADQEQGIILIINNHFERSGEKMQDGRIKKIHGGASDSPRKKAAGGFILPAASVLSTVSEGLSP